MESRVIIALSKKFTFIHIHKTGGSSLKRAIEPHLLWCDLILGASEFGEAINEPYRRHFGLYKHSSVSDVERVCGTTYVDDFYCFALVRHPIARVCSLYNFTASMVGEWASQRQMTLLELRRCVKQPEFSQQSPLNWPTSQAFINSDTFAEYIRSDHLRQDDGFQSQADRLRSRRDGNIHPQIFRLEDKATWLPNLSAKLGVSIELPHYNKSDRKLICIKSVNPLDADFLRNIFEEDFRVFGY